MYSINQSEIMRNYFLVLSAMLLLFVSCSKVPEKIAVTGVSLTATELELAPGETFPLRAAVIPGNASNKDVSWTSAVPSVAMVTDAGLVTALETGASTITVTTADGGFRASCSVNVCPCTSCRCRR